MAPSGFQHGRCYKIISMRDKSVLEVSPGADPEVSPVIVSNWTNNSRQKFKAVNIRPGEFRILSLSSGSGSWDFQPSKPVLYQVPWNNAPNQGWIAEELYPNSNICLIRSAYGGNCLRNLGLGRQVLVDAQGNPGDPNHCWRLELTY